MRILGFLVVLVLFFACEGEQKSQLTKSDLLEGKWRVTHINEEPVDSREGLYFAPNKQYFEFDSQGKPIPRLMEKVWQVKGDTLKLVDFNYEPMYIDKKGTFYYLFDELSEDKMTLILTNKKEPKKITYKKIKK